MYDGPVAMMLILGVCAMTGFVAIGMGQPDAQLPNPTALQVSATPLADPLPAPPRPAHQTALTPFA